MPVVNSATLGPLFATTGALMCGGGVGGGGVPESLWQALEAAKVEINRTLAVVIPL
jgi:hypothetical protein